MTKTLVKLSEIDKEFIFEAKRLSKLREHSPHYYEKDVYISCNLDEEIKNIRLSAEKQFNRFKYKNPELFI